MQVEKKLIHVLKDFDLFCNPTSLLFTNFYNFISFDCLEFSSYIHYIAITYDIKNYPRFMLLDNTKDILKFINNNYLVFAFNHCDGIALPIIKL